MSSIHFKFKSSLEYDTITFDGSGISLADLRESIVAKKKIARSADYTLEITNAQGKQVYTDEVAMIPKNTSVIVKRVPVKRATPVSKTAPPPQKAKSTVSLETLSKTADLAGAAATEQDKIKAMMSQSAEEWHPSHYVRKTVPPSHYTCFKCGQPGHFIRNCPSNGPMDTNYLSAKARRNAGIPREYFAQRPVEEPPAVSALKQDNTRPYSPVVGSDVIDPTKVPAELQCPMCSQLFTDAVVVPCCGTSYCDECIRNYLLEHDLVCPSCKETTSPDNLIANKLLRTSSTNFRNRRKPQAAILPAVNTAASQAVNAVVHAKHPPNKTPHPAQVNAGGSAPPPQLPAAPRVVKLEPGVPVESTPPHQHDVASTMEATASNSTASRSPALPTSEDADATTSSQSSASGDSDSAGSRTSSEEASAPVPKSSKAVPSSGAAANINASIAHAIHAEIAGQQRYIAASSAGREVFPPVSSRPVASMPQMRLPPVAPAPYPPAHLHASSHLSMDRLPHPSAVPMHLLDPMYHPMHHNPMSHDNPYLHPHSMAPVPLGPMDPFFDMDVEAPMPLSAEEFYRAQQKLLGHGSHRDDSSDERYRLHRGFLERPGSDHEYQPRRSAERRSNERRRERSSSASSDRSPPPPQARRPAARSVSPRRRRVRVGRQRSPGDGATDPKRRRPSPANGRRDDKSPVRREKAVPSTTSKHGNAAAERNVDKSDTKKKADTAATADRRDGKSRPPSAHSSSGHKRHRSGSEHRSQRKRSPSSASHSSRHVESAVVRPPSRSSHRERSSSTKPHRTDRRVVLATTDSKKPRVERGMDERLEKRQKKTGDEQPPPPKRIVKIKRRESKDKTTPTVNNVIRDRLKKDDTPSKESRRSRAVTSCGDNAFASAHGVDDDDKYKGRPGRRENSAARTDAGHDDSARSAAPRQSPRDDDNSTTAVASGRSSRVTNDNHSSDGKDTSPERNADVAENDDEVQSIDKRQKGHKKKRKHKRKHKKQRKDGDAVGNGDEATSDGERKRKHKKRKHKHKKSKRQKTQSAGGGSSAESCISLGTEESCAAL